MIVAITGGTGFIGRHLVSHLLAQGDEVRVLTRFGFQGLSEDVKCYKGDLENNACLVPFVEGVDVLYHCAGQLSDFDLMHRVHVVGTQNLIEAASQGIGHWVQLSSVGVYGPVQGGVITETSPINPVGDYEITKAESDMIVLNAAHRGDLSCSILRPSNVYGADMNNQSLFSMINMIDRGLFFFIGRPGASANYIHVDNVVEGLLRCGTMSAAKGNIYNLSDFCPLEEFVQTISEALECKSPVLRVPEVLMRWASKVLGPIPGVPLTQSRVAALTNRAKYSIDSIQKELNYDHIVSMSKGLRELVAAYRSK